MGKRIKESAIRALIISGVQTLIIFLVEGVSALFLGRMPIVLEKASGGEIVKKYGIGWDITRSYSLGPGGVDTNNSVNNIHSNFKKMEFNPNIFIVLAGIWIVVFIILMLVKGKKNNQKCEDVK